MEACSQRTESTQGRAWVLRDNCLDWSIILPPQRVNALWKIARLQEVEARRASLRYRVERTSSRAGVRPPPVNPMPAFLLLSSLVVRGALLLVRGSGGGPINWLLRPVAILNVFVDVGFIQSGQQPVTE
jgi:hypothetical protein